MSIMQVAFKNLNYSLFIYSVLLEAGSSETASPLSKITEGFYSNFKLSKDICRYSSFFRLFP